MTVETGPMGGPAPPPRPRAPPPRPQLHVGRAHNLDGQERHASAWNDALMALRTQVRRAREAEGG